MTDIDYWREWANTKGMAVSSLYVESDGLGGYQLLIDPRDYAVKIIEAALTSQPEKYKYTFMGRFGFFTGEVTVLASSREAAEQMARQVVEKNEETPQLDLVKITVKGK